MKRINYISNLGIGNVGGGWSSFNKNVYDLLKSNYNINLVDAINPPFLLSERILSKIHRYLGIPALFPGFSTSRLKTIARQVEMKIDKAAELNFYHGSTPWVMVKNDRPYACYLDACFSTYLDVYHKGQKFNSKKIEELEANFLKGAKSVFFSSQFALDQAKLAYDLKGDNFYNAGLGGYLPYSSPLPDVEKKRFVFIGHDYQGKGGNLVAEAFRELSRAEPNVKMTFVGGSPPSDVLELPGVEYVGYLDKRNESELRKYINLLNSSIALVLPTNRDMTPLVIIEAGYCGCPSIATNVYGIPELIGDCGYLCSSPVQIEQLIGAMRDLISKKINADSVRDFYVSKFTWAASGRIIFSALEAQRQ